VKDFPRFAVVGHPNKGKSSIVSVISRNENVAVGRDPGTTVKNSVFEIKLGHEVLFALIDTPGFQRSRSFLKLLTKREAGAESRKEVLKQVLSEEVNQKEFPDEVELLSPIMEGAGILYVVDGSIPYGEEFDSELEVLRWTGQPRMALINPIGNSDFVDDWSNALGQYFNIVRVFDAHDGDFDRQVNLLRGFSQLDESWQSQLERAVQALEKDWKNTSERAADSISRLLVKSIQLKLSVPLKGDSSELTESSIETERLEAALKQTIEKFEAESKDEIQGLYKYKKLETKAEVLESIETDDLFSAETWRVFGLSKKEIVKWGAMGGAAVGGGLDLLVGGSSLMMGSLVGAVVGAGGSIFAADKLVDARVLMQNLGERVLEVGPVKNLSLPHILLRRSLLHLELIKDRSHADRSLLDLSEESLRRRSEDLMSDKQKKSFEKIFRAIRKSSAQLEATPLSNISKVQVISPKNLILQDELSELILETPAGQS